MNAITTVSEVGLSDPLIQVRDVRKSYGSFEALSSVSIDIKEGECLALLGPSGCGKTTLLRTIAGLVEPTSGDLLIDGESMTGVPPNLRPVNMVFQNYALFPHLTVAENVAFGPRRSGQKRNDVRDRVAATLKIVGMEDLSDRFPAQLSGGQQQRVALARAIINEPRVLLLDEPLSALDLRLRKRMQLELKHLQQQLGIAFIFVTHDQEEALVMADRIAVMNRGKIVQLGSGAEIYDAPANQYVASFIGEANLIALEAGEGGYVRIAGSGANLPYEHAGDPRNFKLLVRPEDMRIGSAADFGDHMISLPAKLKEVVFVGNVSRIYLTVSGGHTLLAEIRGKSDLAGKLMAGAAVATGWPKRYGRLIPE